MSLLPEDAGYLEHLQSYFLAFRGDGVSLSPLDAQLLAEWQARGVPYSVVCRGIRKAAEAVLYHGGEVARLRTLRSCRSAVEREFKRWEGPARSLARAADPEAAAGPPADPASFAARRIKQARSMLSKVLQQAGPGPLRQAAAAALEVASLTLEDPRRVASLVARADETLALVYLRRLPGPERRELMKKARALAGLRTEGASRRARKDALRAHRVALARAHGQLPPLA